MNSTQKRRKQKEKLLLIICASMVMAAVICFGVWQYLAHLLVSQQAAERWQGEGDMEFRQITCFLPSDQKIELKDIRTFRNAAIKKMQDAALDVQGNPHLMLDAWSTDAKLYTSGEHGRGQASVIAVGGDYFDFHPLQLLSGDYIRQSDLMKDRIVLGEEVAWLLFGGTDLAGMTMELNGKPYLIAGVVEQEQDRFSKGANSDGLDLYMSYDTLLTIDENAKINCYEVLMPNPVKGFAFNAVKDKFPIGRGEILCNTERYGYGKMMDLVLHFGSRGSQVSGAVLPYWENAARGTENWGALCCLLGTVLLIFPTVVLVLTALQSGRPTSRRRRRKPSANASAVTGSESTAQTNNKSNRNKKALAHWSKRPSESVLFHGECRGASRASGAQADQCRDKTSGTSKPRNVLRP